MQAKPKNQSVASLDVRDYISVLKYFEMEVWAVVNLGSHSLV